jgi:hypothetical protein
MSTRRPQQLPLGASAEPHVIGLLIQGAEATAALLGNSIVALMGDAAALDGCVARRCSPLCSARSNTIHRCTTRDASWLAIMSWPGNAWRRAI